MIVTVKFNEKEWEEFRKKFEPSGISKVGTYIKHILLGNRRKSLVKLDWQKTMKYGEVTSKFLEVKAGLKLGLDVTESMNELEEMLFVNKNLFNQEGEDNQ